MSKPTRRVYAPNPILSAPPGIYGERLTGDGCMAGSFVVTLRLPAQTVAYQSEVWRDADLAMPDADGESRLDLLPLVLRAITEARKQ